MNYFQKAQHHVTPYKMPIICMVFLIILIAGIIATFDYGISTDEEVQRKHSIVTYRYVYEKITGKYIQNLDYELYPDLETYSSKYYGTAIQLPLVLIEHINQFNMDTRSIFLMRHIYTFLIFFIALICFFFLCKILFESDGYALLAMLMLCLYPRFFAHAHYNIKDLMFTSLMIISIFFMVLFLKKGRKWWSGFLFSFSTALATNSRVIGIMVLCGAICFMLLEDIIIPILMRKNIKEAELSSDSIGKKILSYIIVAVSFILFYFIFTPAAWSAGLMRFFTKTLDIFVVFDKWDGYMLFFGDSITKEQTPWYYLPAWWGVSIPLAYLIFFIIGIISLCVVSFRGGIAGFASSRYHWIIFSFLALPTMATVVKSGLLYGAWRHLFFVFPSMVYMAVCGIKNLTTALQKTSEPALKTLPAIIICASLLFQTVWIACNHPYAHVYFNTIGQKYAPYMHRDDWNVSYTSLLQYILEHDAQTDSIIVSTRNGLSMNMLTSEEKERFTYIDGLPKNKSSIDYILYNFRDLAGNEYHVKGFEEWYSIWVDGLKVSTILKRIDA